MDSLISWAMLTIFGFASLILGFLRFVKAKKKTPPPTIKKDEDLVFFD